LSFARFDEKIAAATVAKLVRLGLRLGGCDFELREHGE
jgi:hypothetical protein